MNKTKIKRAIFVIVACVMAFSCLKICWHLHEQRIGKITLSKDRHSLDVSVRAFENKYSSESFYKETIRFFRLRMFYALDAVSNRIDAPIVMFCAVTGGFHSAYTTCFIVTGNKIFKIVSLTDLSYSAQHIVSMCRPNQRTLSYIEAFRKSIENEEGNIHYQFPIVFDGPIGFSCARIREDVYFCRMYTDLRSNSSFEKMVKNLMEISFQECE